MKKLVCERCGEVDHVLMDGYGAGDRTLEGVYFKITLSNGRFKAAVMPKHAEYFGTLNQKMWLKEVANYAQDAEEFECPACGRACVLKDDKAKPKPEPKPFVVSMGRASDIFGKLGGKP